MAVAASGRRGEFPYNDGMKTSAVTETDLGIGPLHRGKVRDCYRIAHPKFGDAMLIVSTDRIQGTVCGVRLPAGLGPGSPLPEPIFTPATKAASGHDENVSFDVMAAAVGSSLAGQLRDKSLEVFRRGAEHARGRGIVVADTKFEWGRTADGSLLLVDEVLTPDSSRFWPAGRLVPGQVPDSFDKQFVRDWLDGSGWDKASPPPPLPPEVVTKTQEKYLEACRLLTGRVP